MRRRILRVRHRGHAVPRDEGHGDEREDATGVPEGVCLCVGVRRRRLGCVSCVCLRVW